MSESVAMSEVREIIGICNPAAGGGRAASCAQAARKLVDVSFAAQWHETRNADEARHVVNELGKPNSIILSIGGDGTLHHIVQALMTMKQELRPALAVLPAGSGNDFAFNTGLPQSPEQVVEALNIGRMTSVDVIRALAGTGDVRWIINSMGVNLTAQVSAAARGGSSYAYLAGLAKTLASSVSSVQMKLQADGPVWSHEIMGLAICNGAREGGRFLIAPQASNDDGQLDYVFIEPVSRARLLRILPAALRGTHLGLDGVHAGRGQSLTVKFDRACALHFDGEYVAPESAPQSWEFAVEARALRVVF